MEGNVRSEYLIKEVFSAGAIGSATLACHDTKREFWRCEKSLTHLETTVEERGCEIVSEYALDIENAHILWKIFDRFPPWTFGESAQH